MDGLMGGGWVNKRMYGWLDGRADGWMDKMAYKVAKLVAFLHTAVMATVVMCRVRNPACTATSALEGALHKWLTKNASDVMHMAPYK